MPTELACYFLTKKDERDLSACLCALFPSLVFVDAQVWGSPQPTIKESIADCSSVGAYLWWRDLTPSLPFRQEASNRFRGSGDLLFSHCSLRDGRLYEGQMRVDPSSKRDEIAPVVRTVFKTMRRKYRSTAMCVRFEDDYVYPKELKSILIGPDAAEQSAMGTIKLALNGLSYVVPKTLRGKLAPTRR
jgi:hypothetical protein